MSMDLNNVAVTQQSMGQLNSSFTKLTGAIADMTKQVNAGNTPSVTGGEYGGFGLADTAPTSKSGFSSGMQQAHGGGFPQSGHTVSSMNYHLNDKAPVDPLFGMKYSRKEFMAQMQREARTLSFIANKGYMPPPPKNEETFRASDSLFAKAQLSGQSLNPMGYALNMKFLKVTPQMMLNLGLLPKSLVDGLNATVRTLERPDGTQIINTAKTGETEVAQRMFDNAPGLQEQVADALGTDNKNAKGFKPPSIKKLEGPSKPGEYLN